MILRLMQGARAAASFPQQLTDKRPFLIAHVHLLYYIYLSAVFRMQSEDAVFGPCLRSYDEVYEYEAIKFIDDVGDL